MALYSPDVYDTLHPIYSRQQARNGGLKRAATGKRHELGLFAPDDGELDLPEDYRHGQAGGQARSTGKRDHKGRYVRVERN